MQDEEPIKFETHISLLQLQQPSIFSFLFALLSRFNKTRVNGEKTIDVSHTSCTLYSNDCEMTVFIRSTLTVSGNALIN